MTRTRTLPLRRRTAAGWLAAAAFGVVLAAPRRGLAADPAPEEIASGVYMVRGRPGEADVGNLGRVGNAGFIVGRSGVLAIDTGTSYLHGQALLAAVRTVTDRPVKMALVTHTRQEFLFGGAAYREQGIPIAMHQAAATLMAGRCDQCLKALRGALGEAAMRGTTMYQPDVVFSDPLKLDAAARIGRSVQVLYFGHSSGPGDVAVFDPRAGALFAGGLLDAQRVPDVVDSQLPGWREALRSLRAIAAQVIVPGHGPASPPALVAQVERYLDELETRARALLAGGTPLSEVADAAAMPAYAGWDQFDTVHRRNAAVIYLRAEREQLLK